MKVPRVTFTKDAEHLLRSVTRRVSRVSIKPGSRLRASPVLTRWRFIARRDHRASVKLEDTISETEYSRKYFHELEADTRTLRDEHSRSAPRDRRASTFNHLCSIQKIHAYSAFLLSRDSFREIFSPARGAENHAYQNIPDVWIVFRGKNKQENETSTVQRSWLKNRYGETIMCLFAFVIIERKFPVGIYNEIKRRVLMPVFPSPCNQPRF